MLKDGLAIGALAIVGVIAGGIVIPRLMGANGEVAPTPAAFAEGGTLADGIEQARVEGKPVFAVVTADWCAPCQTYKRTALADARVESVLDDKFVAIAINVDNDASDAMSLGVSAIPTSFIIDADGKVLATQAGVMNTDALLGFLNAATVTP